MSDAGPSTPLPETVPMRIRPGWWVFAVLLSLASAALIPWFPMWGAGLNFANSNYLPMVPLAILTLAALAWNPAMRRLPGLGWLAARPIELLVLGSMLYVVAGLCGSGVASSWRSQLLYEDSASTKDKLILTPKVGNQPLSIKQAAPNALSLGAEKELDRAVRTAESLAVALLRSGAGQPLDQAAVKRLRDDVKGLDLPEAYRLDAAVMTRLEGWIAATPAPTVPASEAAETVNILLAGMRRTEPELRLLAGLKDGSEYPVDEAFMGRFQRQRLAQAAAVVPLLLDRRAAGNHEAPEAQAVARLLGRRQVAPSVVAGLAELVSAPAEPDAAAVEAVLLTVDRARVEDAAVRQALGTMLAAQGAAITATEVEDVLGLPVPRAILLDLQRLGLLAKSAGVAPADGDLARTLAELVTPAPVAEWPITAIVRPLFASLSLVLLAVVLIFALSAFTARQWTHHERLPHPLIQVPVSLADGSLLKHRGFRITVAVMLLIWIYQYAGINGWHPLPKLALGNIPVAEHKELFKMFGIPDNVPDNWVYKQQFGKVQIFPFALGLAFLLAADVGFSLWAGFFFGAIAFGWLFVLGAEVSFSRDGRVFGGGASVGMAVLIFWLGRHHYLRLLRAAVFAGRDPGDPVGVWGARALLVSVVGLCVLIGSYVDGPWWQGLLAGVVGVTMVLTCLLVLARVVAESGLAAFQAPDLNPNLLIASGLPFVVPYQATIMMNWLSYAVATDTRENLAGYAVQSTAMGERGLRQGRLVILLVALAAVVIVITMASGFAATWHLAGGIAASSREESIVNKVFEADFGILGKGQFFLLAGAAMVFVVAWLRRIWSRCPLHPLALVVAVSWPIMVVWGSLFFGWLAKVLVLRYGGSGLYQRLKPIALGFILGDILGFALQALLQVIGHLGQYPWVVWRSYP